MNRRIKGQIFPHMREPEPERLWVAVLVFIAVLAFVALLGVDDFETTEPRQGTTEVIQ